MNNKNIQLIILTVRKRQSARKLSRPKFLLVKHLLYFTLIMKAVAPRQFININSSSRFFKSVSQQSLRGANTLTNEGQTKEECGDTSSRRRRSAQRRQVQWLPAISMKNSSAIVLHQSEIFRSSRPHVYSTIYRIIAIACWDDVWRSPAGFGYFFPSFFSPRLLSRSHFPASLSTLVSGIFIRFPLSRYEILRLAGRSLRDRSLISILRSSAFSQLVLGLAATDFWRCVNRKTLWGGRRKVS